MSESTSPKPAPTKPKRVVQGEKLRGAEKVARVPVKFAPTEPGERLRKPKIRWSRSAKRQAARTLASALAKARRPS